MAPSIPSLCEFLKSQPWFHPCNQIWFHVQAILRFNFSQDPELYAKFIRLGGVPTYVFPADPVAAARHRYPDVNPVRRDAEFTAAAKDIFNVTWEHIADSKWPKPVKACKLCNVRAKNRTEKQTVFLVFFTFHL